MEPRYPASIAATRGLITPSRRPTPDGYTVKKTESYQFQHELKDVDFADRNEKAKQDTQCEYPHVDVARPRLAHADAIDKESVYNHPDCTGEMRNQPPMHQGGCQCHCPRPHCNTQ